MHAFALLARLLCLLSHNGPLSTFSFLCRLSNLGSFVRHHHPQQQHQQRQRRQQRQHQDEEDAAGPLPRTKVKAVKLMVPILSSSSFSSYIQKTFVGCCLLPPPPLLQLFSNEAIFFWGALINTCTPGRITTWNGAAERERERERVLASFGIYSYTCTVLYDILSFIFLLRHITDDAYYTVSFEYVKKEGRGGGERIAGETQRELH